MAMRHDMHRIRRFGVGALTAALMLSASASATAGTPRYPDLRMPSPTDLHLLTAAVNGVQHHRLHFTTRPWNAGAGPFEVHRDPEPSGIAALTQRIYEDPAGFRDERVGSAIFAPTDFVFSLPHIARYELWTERAFARAASRGFTRGAPIAYRDGVTHCVADSQQLDPDATPVAVYAQCNKFVIGISPGWADVEGWPEDFQSVDVGTAPLPDGDYVVRAIVDPENLLFESDGKADPSREGWVANSGITYFRIVGGQLAGVDDDF